MADVQKKETEKKKDKEPSEAHSSHCVSRVVTNLPVDKVIIHPLVLLSVVDHFNRVTKGQSKPKRVVGVLLGSVKPGKTKELDVANSFAVPFDEDEHDSDVWFVDNDYLESMYAMFHKVAARERIVGWYHTGPKLHPSDIAINQLMKKHTPNPVLVIITAEPKELGLPTDAYVEVEEVHDDGSPPMKTFEHVPTDVDAEEAEEVGVEHLLRDIKDQTAGTLSQKVTNQLRGLRGLQSYLNEIKDYMNSVVKGELPINHTIMYMLQDARNLLPDVYSTELARSLNVQTNDQLMNIYIGALARSIIAIHNLVDNKQSLRETEREAEKEANEKKDAEKNKDKPKEGEEKKDGAAGGDSTPSSNKEDKDKSKDVKK